MVIGAPRWTLGKVPDNGVVTLVACREDIPAEVKAKLPSQFVVEWKLSDVFADGLPTELALAPALRLQEKVTPVLEAAGDAVLAVISTGHGYRELYFYCTDPLVLQERFNECVAGEELPIELHAGSDASWKVFEEFAAPLKGRRTMR